MINKPMNRLQWLFAVGMVICYAAIGLSLRMHPPAGLITGMLLVGGALALVGSNLDMLKWKHVDELRCVRCSGRVTLKESAGLLRCPKCGESHGRVE